MKVLFASILVLVGSCASLRHSEKIEQLKNNIEFKDENVVQRYLNTITVPDIKSHVLEISDDKYEGRKTGENGHNEVCKYLINYYKDLQLSAPAAFPDYKQPVPKEFLPEGLNDSQNIIAFIKGAEFPQEYVYVMAHSDHEGILDGEIYNGADDNASGTSAVLEIAEAFKIATDNGIRPKRSVVFLHATAEEVGLHGSRYYAEHPAFALNKTVAALNTDMIGRVDEAHKADPNYIYLIGSDRISSELHFIAQKANEQFTQLDLDYTFNSERDANKYYYRSDHYNFAKHEVPVIFFFNGEHEDYTKPTDTAEKINYELLTKRTKLIFSIAWYLANSEKKLSKGVL